MTDLGELHHFLGMHVQRCGSGLLLSQRQYMVDILDRAGMAECKPCSTVDTNPKLATDGPPVQDASEFRSLAVPHLHQAGYRLRCSAGLLAYARSVRASPYCIEAYPVLYQRDTSPGASPSTVFTERADCVLRCRLGRLSGYSQIHIGLCGFSRGQPGF